MGELSICAGWKTGTVDEAPRSDAAPETSTGPTIERRAIKRAALLPRFHATSPAIVSLGAAWLGAEQFRPQHFRNKEGDPPMQPTSGTSTILAKPGHCRAGDFIAPAMVT